VNSRGESSDFSPSAAFARGLRARLSSTKGSAGQSTVSIINFDNRLSVAFDPARRKSTRNARLQYEEKHGVIR